MGGKGKKKMKKKNERKREKDSRQDAPEIPLTNVYVSSAGSQSSRSACSIALQPTSVLFTRSNNLRKT